MIKATVFLISLTIILPIISCSEKETIIEEGLTDFILCSDIVPTNTEEDWYKELITLGVEEVKLSFKQNFF